ncbi:MAG TPA: DNA polymerase domain-containing protein [Thermodesulfovibrionia bacterium]|nr:DNA polymerase domain-containing protein [Thermodesulfovibrionia bacterium]
MLFGADTTVGIVAVELAGQEDRIRLFIRDNNNIRQEQDSFTPFMLIEQESLLNGFKRPFSIKKLSSDNPYRFLVTFTRWDDCVKAKTFLQKKTGQSPSSTDAPYLFNSDPVLQYLLLTGKTLFKGLTFQGLHRLALDIETACSPGYTFSNPERMEDRIISVALMDNQGREDVIFGKDYDEKEMLLRLNEKIAEYDPDVIEGHNIFNFDLEYIAARAKKHGVKLLWGRDGSEPDIRRSRFSVAERTIDYTRFNVFGRHIVDTMFLLYHYDITAREMESYGLKSAAEHFGLAQADRVYIDGAQIDWYYHNDPEQLKKYNLDDVRETLALSELLGYSFFLQTRIFPYSYQNIFVRGNATRINSLFLREYLRQRVSIPKPQKGSSFAGGYTDVLKTGVIKDVYHCDAASLYPSIMLVYGLRPSGDSLDVFLPLLKTLRAFRLEAKRAAALSEAPHEHDYFQALQQTFKILINSFYGYLGTDLHNFSDPAAASEITKQGRALLQQMVDWLQQQGAIPVEIDTDGIYFIPPSGVNTWESVTALVSKLSAVLPEGIEVELDGYYPAMLSYKMKNYALLDKNGKVIIRGSALKSRGMEKYLRVFLARMLQYLLEGRAHEIAGLYHQYMDDLENHRIDISWLAKKETLTESPENYAQKVRAKKRNQAAPYELALASGRTYRAGDQVAYYVTGRGKKVRVFDNCKLLSGYDSNHPDANAACYQEKLIDLIKKFQDLLPSDILDEGNMLF